MKVLVTIKRVTDPNMKVRMLPDGSGVDTSNIDYKINPFDEYALEQALRLREANRERIEEVVVVSVGDKAASKELRIAMAMGADRGIMVECDDATYDAMIVSDILAAVVAEEAPDIVLMGKLAVDGENNQVSQMLAHKLGWPQGTFALDITLGDTTATVVRQADGGQLTTELNLPCVISRTDMPDEDVRYASLPGIMKAKKKPLKTVTPDELGVDVSPFVRILGYELPAQRESGQIVASVDELVEKLQTEVKAL